MWAFSGIANNTNEYIYYTQYTIWQETKPTTSSHVDQYNKIQ